MSGYVFIRTNKTQSNYSTGTFVCIVRQGHINMQQKIDQFKTVMLSAGVPPPDNLIPDGTLHRFNIDGKLNGWYVLHLDGRAAGCFGDWKQGIKEKWKLDDYTQKFTDEQLREFKANAMKVKAEEQAAHKIRHDEAADKARYLWSQAKSAINHPYLTRKNIKPHGVKITNDGRLIIPLFDESIEIVNIQFIGVDGAKRFLAGGRKKGCFFVIGTKSERILICEGLATGASIHESTGEQVVVAFDAGNLDPVAKVIRSCNPSAEIVIISSVAS